MPVIDREPTANIGAVVTTLEDPLRPALSEIQAVFEEEPHKEAIVGIGSNRFFTRLWSTLSLGFSKIKDSVSRLKRRGSGRSRRNRGCSCRRETTSFSGTPACMQHSGIPRLPGLRLIPPRHKDFVFG
ncbi:hypothetical protein HY008_00840 [Candidatus Woesebacteria bacterium]|nr:hypothetical protein [Candidatus Woesebacteria bacterium]